MPKFLLTKNQRVLFSRTARDRMVPHLYHGQGAKHWRGTSQLPICMRCRTSSQHPLIREAHLNMHKNEELKYQDLNATHIFNPIAIETAGSWDDQAVELREGIGRRSAQETDDPKETMYLFQSISVKGETHWLSPIRLIPTISNNPSQSL